MLKEVEGNYFIILEFSPVCKVNLLDVLYLYKDDMTVEPCFTK